jgi:predicted nuclease of predicted toxin-antitoxin system
MRLLCDQNVAAKYMQAFDGLAECVVTTVADELSPDASDEEIVEFAATHDWVVFTSDDDFFEHADQCGVLVYNQLMDPSPGDVLEAVRAIEKAYESNQDIIETVPGSWVSSF